MSGSQEKHKAWHRIREKPTANSPGMVICKDCICTVSNRDKINELTHDSKVFNSNPKMYLQKKKKIGSLICLDLTLEIKLVYRSSKELEICI